MSRKDQLSWYSRQEKVMSEMSLFPLHFKPKPCSPFVSKVLKNATKQPVRHAYFTVQTGNPEESCKITVELFAKSAPFTVANFEKIVSTKKEECGRSYRCKKFEKLVSISKRGFGPGEPQYWKCAPSTGVFPQFAKYVVGEDSKLKHDTGWLLTKPKQIATGEFYITVGPALYLDKLCTVFGRIGEAGQKFLEEMQNKNVDSLGFPTSSMFIAECGLISQAESSNIEQHSDMAYFGEE